jgi:cyclophilin family peptidyl-prolyl cis-trans isomerase
MLNICTADTPATLSHFTYVITNKLALIADSNMTKVQRKSSKAREWVMRMALFSGLLFGLLFLVIYFRTLSAALNESRPIAESTVQEDSQPLNANKVGYAAAAAKQEAPVIASSDSAKDKDAVKETLVLTTTLGEMRIVLRPDLSKESVQYVKKVVLYRDCPNCRFYRAEKPGILQGILKGPDVTLNEVKGSCPPGYESVPNDCPEWDKSCGCHGPVMTRGMVGWAAGATGPDFFIDAYQQPAKWWGTQHTVWGEIQDEATLEIIAQIWSLPTSEEGGLTFLKEPIKFQKLRIETASE